MASLYDDEVVPPTAVLISNSRAGTKDRGYSPMSDGYGSYIFLWKSNFEPNCSCSYIQTI